MASILAEGGGRANSPCRRFNRGRCNYGVNCRYEHRCTYCNKYGHGSVNCRKAIADRSNNNTHHNQNNQHRDGSGGGGGGGGFVNKKNNTTNNENNSKPIQVASNN